MKVYNLERKNILDWDTYFMAIAKLVSVRSKDPSTQVGCCLVSEDNKVLSTGYNGAPKGFDDACFPWGREGNALEIKYLYTFDAEQNAIMNYKGSKRDLEGCRVYVTLFPCNECAQLIVHSKAREIIYLSDKYAENDDVIASKRILDACGIKYRQFKSDVVINFDFK